MIKAIGSQVVVKVIKRKSSLDLSAASSVQVGEEIQAVIESVGTKCSLGVRPGHQVMFKHGTMPVNIQSTDDFDMLLIPEVSIAFVSNWTEEDEAGLL